MPKEHCRSLIYLLAYCLLLSFFWPRFQPAKPRSEILWSEFVHGEEVWFEWKDQDGRIRKEAMTRSEFEALAVREKEP